MSPQHSSRYEPTRAIEDRRLAARIVSKRPLRGVTAGSALLRVGERFLVVHDDAFRVSWIAPASLGVTPLVLAGDGAPLAKSDKPDFEAAIRTTDGTIYVLGSGATPKRCFVARIEPHGTAVSLRDRTPLYRTLEAALAAGERPNLEGAIALGDRVRLFHRAAGRTPNVTFDLPHAVLDGATPRVLAVRAFDLGAIDGVRLGFSDAAALPDDRTAFLAVAENAPDAIADGPVMGSAVGLIESDAGYVTARWTRLLEADGRPSTLKVEGLAVDDDLEAAWLVTDTDDPSSDATLVRAELEGFG